jgi:glycosyltransferase involved in cell wall biosynthesis
MNVLILNWRDPDHSLSGGAEKLNKEIVQPLINRGDSVIWYSQAQKDLKENEKKNGITYIRFGNVLTHYIMWPIWLYTGKFGKVDLIIDCIHGTGYLSSLFAPRTRKFILICEVAQNIWDEMVTFPINKIGKVWEKMLFRFYNKEKMWTISESTKKDLIRYGVDPSKVSVLPMGFNAYTLSIVPKKNDEPTALFVGRIAEMKGIRDAIEAVAEVNKVAIKKWNLKIIGRGDLRYVQQLKDLVEKENIQEHVTFMGFLSEKDKALEMAKAWVLLVPSSREGWGMIVPEANSVGTPVIGYDVSGLRDVMRTYSKSNILIKPQSIQIVDELHKLERQPKILDKPIPGWQELHKFVLAKI